MNLQDERGPTPRPPARIVIMMVGPVPIVRMPVREIPGDWVIGSFVCSNDREADIGRSRRGAERRGSLAADTEPVFAAQAGC